MKFNFKRIMAACLILSLLLLSACGKESPATTEISVEESSTENTETERTISSVVLDLSDITKSKDTQDDKKNFPDELPVFTDALWQTFPILESAKDSIAELLNQKAISLETGRIDNTYAVADLLLKRKNPDAKEEIASITLHTNVHAEKVFSADTSRIITESGKVFQIPNDFMVYSAGSTVEDFTVSPIANLVRAKESYLIEKNEESDKADTATPVAIAAIITDKTYDTSIIRCLISSGSEAQYSFEQLHFESGSPLYSASLASLATASDANEKASDGDADVAQSISTGSQSLSFAASDLEENEVVKVWSENPDSRIVLSGFQKSELVSPSYRGFFYMIKKDGLLSVVNELSLEEYLYAVVSSEVPASFHQEALAAMAVASRCYATSAIGQSKFGGYGADLDDTTMSQVYNSTAETYASRSAVDETKGILMLYEGSIVNAVYFSTSAGLTANAEEAWGAEYPYLKAKLETENPSTVDFSKEETFDNFIDTSSVNGISNTEFFENDKQFFRWHVSYTTEELESAISAVLEDRMASNPDNFEIIETPATKEDAELTSSPTDADGLLYEKIGDLKNIQVTSRYSGGTIEELTLTGTKATMIVHGQTNFRQMLNPSKQTIVCQDGRSISGWTSLPSNFYYIQKTDKGYTVKGGGFGHGIGLSQYGAEILAGKGYGYKQILEHYYTGITFSE